MTFRISGDADIKIIAVFFSNVFNQIDGVREHRVAGSVWCLLTWFISSQRQNILTAGIVGSLAIVLAGNPHKGG